MAQIPTYGQFSANQAEPQPTISDKEKQPQGTGYTNLQRILGANQGAGAGLQQATVGGIQKVGQQAQQGLQTAQQQFGQGIGQAQQTQSNRQSMVQNTLGALDQPDFQAAPQGAAQGFSDLRSAQYNGPTGLQNSQQLQQQAQLAAQYGQLAGSRNGRQELLRQTVGQPGYTSGQQRLDELLLGQASPALRQAAQQTQREPADINRAIAAASGQGSAQAQALKKLQQQASQGIQSRQDALNANLSQAQQSAQNTEAARQAQVSALQQALVSGQAIDPTKYANSGLTAQQISDLQAVTNPFVSGQYGAAGNQYATSIGNELASAITAGSNPTGLGDVATSAQRAKSNALSSLAGQPGQFTNYTPTQAQAAGINPLAKDFSGNLQHQLQLEYGIDPSQLSNIDTGRLAQNILSTYGISPDQMAAINPAVYSMFTGQPGELAQEGLNQALHYDQANPQYQQSYNQLSPALARLLGTMQNQ